jgi:hypothetical protein
MTDLAVAIVSVPVREQTRARSRFATLPATDGNGLVLTSHAGR